jgi:hypothetical protein
MGQPVTTARERAALAGARPATLGRLARRMLYTRPALRLLGHMLLVVARRS